MSKSKAFVLTVICIFIMFLVAMAMQFLGKLEGFPVGSFLTAIVTIGTCFIGLQVANNGVRGAFCDERIAKIDAANENGGQNVKV